jgi:alpha-beta hydrolase superfamily lysophospholipase
MMRREFLGASLGYLCCVRDGLASPTLGRGLWCDESGAFAIGRCPEFGTGLFGFDYSIPRCGLVQPVAGGSWNMSGSLDGKATPVQAIHVRHGTLVIGGRQLRPVPLDRTRFDVTSESVRLSGEIAARADQAPRGTVMLIYGSGPAGKEAFDLWAFWFIAKGFKVITADKRGCGRSQGDWRLTSLESLAQDALVIVNQARSCGARGPLYVWGASQGGWIEPQLGAAGAVDGIIMHAGSAMLPREQMLAAVEAELRAYEFQDDEIARALAYYALDTDVCLGVRPWSDIEAAYAKASAAGAEWLLAPPAKADAPERTMIRLMANFDPAPYWGRSKVPTLAIYGGKDWIVPAADNLAALNRIIAPNTDLKTEVLPAANHLMFVAKTGVRPEYPTLSRIDPGYFGAMSRWLDARS